MGKIPRAEKGNRPSGVPNSALSLDPGGALGIIDSLDKLADTGFAIASEQEVAEAQRRRAVMEEKLSVENAVAVDKNATDYQLGGQIAFENIQTENFDAPEKWVPLLAEQLEDMEKSVVGEAQNPEIARQSISKLGEKKRSLLLGAFTQSEARRTQKIKGGLEEVKNGLAAGAEKLPVLESIDAYLANQVNDVKASYMKAWGKEGELKFKELQNEVVYAAAVSKSHDDFIGVLRWLETSETADKKLTDTQRETIRQKANTSLQNYGKDSNNKLVKELVDRGSQYYKSWIENKADMGVKLAEDDKLKSQIKVIEANSRLNFEQKKEQKEKIKGQLRANDILDDIRRKGMGYDIVDNIEVKTELQRQYDDLVKKPTRKVDLNELLRFRTSAIIHAGNGKLNTNTLNTYVVGADTAINTKRNKYVGPDFAARIPFLYDLTGLGDSPRVAAVRELDALFSSSKFKELNPGRKADIHQLVTEALNEAADNKQTLTDEQARALAQKILYQETGKKMNIKQVK